MLKGLNQVLSGKILRSLFDGPPSLSCTVLKSLLPSRPLCLCSLANIEGISSWALEVEGASNEFWPQKDKVRLEDWDTHPVTGGAAKEGHQGQSHLCNEALWVKTHRDRLAHSGLSVFICEPKNSVPPKGG